MAIVVSAANGNDKCCALELLDRLCVPRPKTVYLVHHLCADKAYDSADVREGIRERHYRAHLKRRGSGLRC